MDNDALYGALKAQQWEKAKCEIQAMIALVGARSSGDHVRPYPFEVFQKFANEFIRDIEDHGLHECAPPSPSHPLRRNRKVNKTGRILQHLLDRGAQTDAEIMEAFPPGSGHFSRAFRSGLIERVANTYRITKAGTDELAAIRAAASPPNDGTPQAAVSQDSDGVVKP